MAGSSVKLYYDTKIRPEKNARIEGLETYLASKITQSITLNKYVKHDLSVSIKIDTEELGSYVWTGDVLNPFASGRLDYVSIKNDKDTGWIYYFVMNQAWTASKTVTLELALDTINSFDGCYEFTDRTVVTREHKSRYNDENEITYKGITYIPREFYLDGDGIQPQLYKQDEWTITDSKANYDWYLLYMANNTSGAVEGKDYPINAYLVSSESYKRTGVRYSLKVSDLDNTQDYWFGPTMTGSYDTSDAFVIGDKGYNVSAVTLIQWEVSPKGHWVLRKQKPTSSVMQDIQDLSTNDVLVFQSQKLIYKTARANYNNVIKRTPEATGASVVSNKTGTVQPTSGEIASEISSIETVDRTDTRIISIIKLPYCPVPVTITNDVISYPDYINENIIAWQNGSSRWYLQMATNFLSGFENEIGIDFDKFISGWMVPKQNLISAVTRSQFYESALYRSEYFQMKFVYDSFNYVIQNELINETTYVGKDLSKPWYMKMVTTSTMNSRFLFDFNDNNKGINYWKELQDYPYLMNIARNNNIVTYNSEYVNYMRNGYNYDVKAKNAALLSAGLGIATGVIGTGLSLSTSGIGANILAGIQAKQAREQANIFAGGAGLVAKYGAGLGEADPYKQTAGMLVGRLGNTAQEQYAAQQKFAAAYNPTAGTLAIGQMINGATSVISSIESIRATERTFEQKQQQIKQASVSVSGSDDIDLLSYYSGNRMKLERWEASPRMQKALFDLYYYQGYATNEQKVPLHNGRKWFDFLQCQADIKNTKNLDQRYIDNLKDRFGIGVTYYHNNNGVWDIDQEKENIETWIS